MQQSLQTRSIIFLFAVIAIAACDSSDDDTSITSGQLSWAGCETSAAIECATLQVPQNHADSAGEKISIALNRLPATGSSPLGSLLFNPGGPGGSGLQSIEAIAEDERTLARIRESYHLIGFDPRGVGKSTPLDCNSLREDDLNPYPLNRADIEEIFTKQQAFSDACTQKYGSYLQHVGSDAVTDDMELIRIALNEPSLNFVAYSYGTRLAALYAQNYPATTGRMILDGSLPPSHANAVLFGEVLPVMELNLTRLAQTCQQFSNCDPFAYKQKLVDRIKFLIDNDSELELELLAGLLIVAVQESSIIDVVAQPLYTYSQAWEVAPLLELADALADDDEDEDDSGTIEYAVLCADDAHRPSVDAIEALRDPFNNTSDLFGELQLAAAAGCAGWPEAINPLTPIATNQAPEILVIGSPSDVQTIEAWGQQMAAAIGGRYLRSEHEGHTVVFTEKNSCTDEVATTYLLTGQLPDTDVCPADN